MESKFLSEVFTINDFNKKQVNLLDTGTGAGKTTLAINLIKSIPNCKALYLIDTTNGKESILQSNQVVEYTEHWRKFVDNTLFHVSEIEDEEFLDSYKLNKAEKEIEIIFKQFENKPVIMTYQQYGHLLQKYTNFLDFLDIIIMDEAHNLVKYYEMDKGKQKKQLLKTNPHATKEQISVHLKLTSPLYLAVQSLSKISEVDCYAIAMTATPTKFNETMEYLKLETNRIETDIQLVAYQTLETQYYSNILQQILKIPKNTKAIIFTPNIKHMKELLRFIDAKMPHKGIAIWSIHNTDFPMNQDQLKVREHLKINKKLPEDVDILIINKSYETGINIIDEEVKQMIIHTREEDTITQVRGRLRIDLPKLCLLQSNSNTDDLIIGKEFIQKKLFSKEKEELSNELKIQKNGRFLKWRGIKKILEEQGWKITEGQTRKGRYSIIEYKITM